MNNSKTPTSEKIGIPLRLEPQLYEKMISRVQKEKKKHKVPYLPPIEPRLPPPREPPPPPPRENPQPPDE